MTQPAGTTSVLSIDPGARVLAVMARQPVEGAVKTRLAAAIGAPEALAVYGRLLTDTMGAAERVENAVLVQAIAAVPGAPPPAPRREDRWLDLVQRGETLGERLAAVFADLFDAGASAVVALNSDSPQIPSVYLSSALDEAAPGRVVVGPAADGGFYAFGLDCETWSSHRAALERLLLAGPMGTSSLLPWTLAAIADAGLVAVQLPLWLDVDAAADLPLAGRLGGHDGLRGSSSARLGLREIYLHVTNRCGSACAHCYNKANPWDPDELSETEWRIVIDDCIELGAASFVFLGGDPLLRKDLCALIDHVTGRHGRKARLFFNSPITQTLATEFAAAGHGSLRPLVSIDGPEDIHDELRGSGNHAAVLASIANLRAAGLEPVANTVLLRPTLAGLPDLARELTHAGVGRLHLILPHQRGGLPENPEMVPSGAEMLAAVRELLAVAAPLGLSVDNLAAWRRRLARPQDFCAAGCRDLAIDPYGRVHACTITTGDAAFVAGDLRRESLRDIVRSSPGLRLLRAARARDRAECAACPVVDACGGECWMQAHYAARVHDAPAGPLAPFPYCDLVRPLFSELLAEDARMATGAVARAGGGQAAAGADDYALFDCI